MNTDGVDTDGALTFGKFPIPRKMRDAIKALPADARAADIPPERVRALKATLNKMGQEDLADLAKTWGLILKRCEAAGHSTLEAKLQHFHDENCAITHNNPTFGAVVPIFLLRASSLRPEQIGSGVLIQIGDNKFLLTATHVTDHENDGVILVPGQNELVEPTGYFASMRMPASGKREDDEMDIAYYLLSDDCAAMLDRELLFLDRLDVSLEGEPKLRMEYTFAGFPWRRSRVTQSAVEPDFATFSGVEVTASDYGRLGLRRDVHIAIRFNRKNTFSQRQRRRVISPLPEGISGGGVFAWTEDALTKTHVRLPLAGVAHGFLRDENVLVATRLHAYVRCIFYQHPKIASMHG